MWEQGAAFWTSLATLTPGFTPEAAVESPKDRPKDRRFADPDWTANPAFALIRQTYGLLRSEEHTSELQLLMRISSAVFCLKKEPTLQQTTSQINSLYVNTI